ncbi:MAG: hypothetical protein AB2421_12500 [Thermotaleaceae bacterium]
MKPIKVITDSLSDIPKTVIHQYEIGATIGTPRGTRLLVLFYLLRKNKEIFFYLELKIKIVTRYRNII